MHRPRTLAESFFVLACGAALASGCARHDIPRPAGIESYRTVAVEVSATDTGLPASLSLRELVAEALRRRAVFERVATAADAPREGLLVRVQITEVRRVSNLRRIDLGRLADSNEVRVEVELVDIADRRSLSAFRLTGMSPERAPLSPDWPWGSVARAAERVAERLARMLEEWVGAGHR